MTRLRWQVRCDQVPLEAWCFAVALQDHHALFLSLRPDCEFWRGFVVTGARRLEDLYSCRWSPDVLAEHFAQFRERQLGEAQERLVAILGLRLGVEVGEIQPARGGRLDQQRRLTTAQVQQWAATQPRRR